MATKRDEYLLRISVAVQNDKALAALTRELERTTKAAKQAEKTIPAVTKSTKKFGQTAQNVGFQVQDLVVQLEGGVAPLRAIGQQLPQALVGFGAFGAALGVVAALLPAIVRLFQDTEEEIESTGEAAEASSARVSKMADAFNRLSSSVSKIDLSNFVEQFQQATEAQQELLLGTLEFQKRVGELALDEALSTLELPFDVGFDSGRAAREIYIQQMEAFGESIGLAAGEVIVLERTLQDALNPLTRSSESIGELVTELQALFVAGGSGNAELEKTINLLLKAEQAARQLEGVRNDVISPVEPEGQTRSAGQARAANETAKAYEDLYRIYEKLNPEATKYFEQVKFYNEALAAGLVTQQEWKVATDQLANNYAKAGEAAQFAATASEDLITSNNKVEEQFSVANEALDIFASTSEAAFNGVAMGTQSVSDAFENMVKSITAQLAKLLALKGIEMLFPSLQGLLVTPSAKGNAFMNGSVTAFAKGGVVSSPTIFPMAKGVGLMGEAGSPEAIMPLTRTSSGNLGVEATGMNVTVNNMSPAQIRTTQTDDGLNIDVIMDTIASAVQRGGNNVADALESTYPISRGARVY